jgi:anti-anti-sigma factor
MLESNRHTFEVDGELSFDTVPELNRRGYVFIKKELNPVFDLDKVAFSDNSGVALLVSWARYAKSVDKKITFVNVPKQLLSLIEASGLREMLPILVT